MYPWYLYNPVAGVPQPILVPMTEERIFPVKTAEYFVSHTIKQLNSKPKPVLKTNNIAYGDSKENKSDLTETPYLKINVTVVSPKPIVNHDFKKKVDLAKKRSRKLKEEARDFVMAPESFEQLKAENLQDLVNEYEQESSALNTKPVKEPTLSDLSNWVIEQKEKEGMTPEERKRRYDFYELAEGTNKYREKAFEWDKESARILEQKTKATEREEKLVDLIGAGLFAEALHKTIFRLKNKKPKSFKRLVQLELDDLYEQTHHMRDVINAFNQRNK